MAAVSSCFVKIPYLSSTASSSSPLLCPRSASFASSHELIRPLLLSRSDRSPSPSIRCAVSLDVSGSETALETVNIAEDVTQVPFLRPVSEVKFCSLSSVLLVKFLGK